MQRKKGRLPIIIGLFLLVMVIIVGAYLWLLRRPTGGGGGEEGGRPSLIPPTPVPKVRVLVANQVIPADTALTPELIDQYFEATEVERTKVLGEDVIGSEAQLLGMVTRVSLQPGEFARLSQLEKMTLSRKIPQGKRAVPLPVDQFSGVVGRIAAGDYVDVIFSGQITLHYPQAYPPTPGETGSMSPASLLSVKTVLQDIQVLEVISAAVIVVLPEWQPTPPPGTEGPPPQVIPTAWILILAMDDQQAEALKFAQEEGMAYQLLLRPRADHTLDTTSGITTWILIDKYGMPVPKHVAYEISPGELPHGVIP